MASPPAFTFGLDWLDRPIITSAKATTSLVSPLETLNSRARRDVIFAPLSRDERRLMKMSKALPFDERRVVMHWMLVSRTETYLEEQKRAAEQASRDRAADIVEDERRKSERHAGWLATRAALEQNGNKPNSPGQGAAAKPTSTPVPKSNDRAPTPSQLQRELEHEGELEDDYDR